MTKKSDEEIYQLIEEWHTTKPNCSLCEYLGMSWEEYAKWIEQNNSE